MIGLRSMRIGCLVVLLLAAALLAACGKDTPAPAQEEPPAVTVIEAGVPLDVDEGPAAAQPETDPQTPADPAQPEPDPEQPPADVFVDLGEAATLTDVIANQARIESFYFEQSVNYPDGSVFMQVWYKGGKMKLVSSVNGVGLTESYYDYEAGLITTLSPGSSDPAMRMSFDPSGADAPDNPVLEDYSGYTQLGGEYLDRQYCLILETGLGDKIWLGTKYGFPVKTEYTDSLGSRMIAEYKNVEINTVQDQDVTLPANVEIYYYGS